MARAKLDLYEKTDDELVTLAELIKARLASGEVVPLPVPAHMDLTGPLGEAKSAREDLIRKTNALRSATTQKAEAMQKLRRNLTTVAAYVEGLAEGQEQVLRSAGLEVRRRRSPINQLGQPGDLRTELAPKEGQVKLRWKRVHGAKSYEVHLMLRREALPVTAAPGEPTGAGTGTPSAEADSLHDWQPVTIVTAARALIQNLRPGGLYAFRVRGIGTAGHSPWSDLAVQRSG